MHRGVGQAIIWIWAESQFIFSIFKIKKYGIDKSQDQTDTDNNIAESKQFAHRSLGRKVSIPYGGQRDDRKVERV